MKGERYIVARHPTPLTSYSVTVTQVFTYPTLMSHSIPDKVYTTVIVILFVVKLQVITV